MLTGLLWAGSVRAQWVYTTNSGAITITGYTGGGGAVTITNTINGMPVTRIAYPGFLHNSNITSLTIPDSVVTIENQSVSGCSMMNSVTIGSGVTNIEILAFDYNRRLTSFVVNR
jgi:hypothetical protein